MKRNIVIASFVIYAVIGGIGIAQAETVLVKDRGMVDLRGFSCTDTDSSFVHRICYKSTSQYLVVLLNDTYYHYCEIPGYAVQQWLDAESKGRFYNANIKGRFDCRLSGYTVTPRINGFGGAISPPEPVLAYPGDKFSFTIMPSSGYTIDSVGGTCGGKLSGNVYETNEISRDCTVVVKFRQ